MARKATSSTDISKVSGVEEGSKKTVAATTRTRGATIISGRTTSVEISTDTMASGARKKDDTIVTVTTKRDATKKSVVTKRDVIGVATAVMTATITVIDITTPRTERETIGMKIFENTRRKVITRTSTNARIWHN